MNISFIGYGHMAKALAHGLRDYYAQPLTIHAAAPSLKIETNEQGIHTTTDNLAVVKHADVLFLAVKPHHLADAYAEIVPFIPASCLVISVAAGVPLAWFKQYKPEHIAIVRTMPNLAATYGQSATPMVANEYVTPHQKKITENMLNALGIARWVSCEDKIDALTALAGSGPAYIFYIMQAMVEGARYLGIEEELAETFTKQTVAGALSLANHSSKSFNDLQKEVTSPQGTTAAAIKVLKDTACNDSIKHALKAAYERAKQLTLNKLRG